jgi:FkbM family methyltransferase
MTLPAAQRNTSTILGRVVQGIAREGVFSLPRKFASLIRMIWRQTTFRPYVITKDISGEKLKFSIEDFWAEDWYAVTNVLQEGPWVRSQLEEGDLFVDCGSHHGLFTLLASKWVGKSGSVIAIEALPKNAETIRKNVDLNDAKNATVFNVAASSAPGAVYVEYKKFGFLNDSNGMIRSTPHKGTVTVESKTIDSLLNGRKAKFLKIDVEGHEVEVLKGARSTLAQRPSLDIEVHCSLWSDAKEKVEEIFELLPLSAYSGMIQYETEGPLVVFNESIHTSEFIASLQKVNLFLQPKHR